MSEFEFEPVRGLPEHLPAGERLLWQGAPAAGALARHAYHVRLVGLYFVAVLGLRAATQALAGAPAADILAGSVPLLAAAAVALAVLGGLAWLVARTTVYTITSRRVVLRFGVAIPMTVNVPFRLIESAAVARHPDGTGDIPLALSRGTRVSYLVFWPHVRPWRMTHPQPMLRAVPAPEAVAKVLADALAASGQEAVEARRVASPDPESLVALARAVA